MVTLKLPLINRRTFKVELVNPVIYVIGYPPEAQQFYVWTGKNQVIPSIKIKMR